MVDLCTQERAFAAYKKRPNIDKMLEGPGEELNVRDQEEFDEVVDESKALLNIDREERERIAREFHRKSLLSSSGLDQSAYLHQLSS